MMETPRTSRWDEVDAHDPEIHKAMFNRSPGGFDAAREWLRRSWRPLAAGATAVVLILGVILGSWAIWFRTTPIDLTVESVRWSRQIEVEQFKTLNRDDWGGSVPSDARVYDVRSEYHHTNTIYLGQTCSGTGSSRSCVSHYTYIAIYRDRYYYQVDRWVQDRWLTAAGTDYVPMWPDVPADMVNPVPDIIGRDRQGDETKINYTVYVAHGKQKWGEHVSLDTFLIQPVGAHVTGHINAADQLRSVEWNTVADSESTR